MMGQDSYLYLLNHQVPKTCENNKVHTMKAMQEPVLYPRSNRGKPNRYQYRERCQERPKGGNNRNRGGNEGVSDALPERHRISQIGQSMTKNIRYTRSQQRPISDHGECTLVCFILVPDVGRLILMILVKAAGTALASLLFPLYKSKQRPPKAAMY